VSEGSTQRRHPLPTSPTLPSLPRPPPLTSVDFTHHPQRYLEIRSVPEWRGRGTLEEDY
jgi:hypothetical protein